MRRRCVLLLALLCGCSPPPSEPLDSSSLRLGALLQEGANTQPFERAETARAFRFPEDHGAHPTFRSEWWYVTANLTAEDGRAFGVQFTIFRQALAAETAPPDNPWSSQQVYLAHFAISDVAAGEHTEAEWLSRAHPALAGADGTPPVVRVGGWRLTFDESGFDVAATHSDIAVALRFDATKPVVAQGDAGLSRKSPGNASYYYSFPRLTVRGTLRSQDGQHAVTGLAWFDHEWSTSVLSDAQTGWDWFALHLRDGRDLMAFRLRRADGMRDPFDHGVIVAADGSHRGLTHEDFTLTPVRWWADADGVRWPVAWHLDTGGERLVIRAAFEDQRMQTLISYWEGVVWISNEEGERLGEGYMELTGYAP